MSNIYIDPGLKTFIEKKVIAPIKQHKDIWDEFLQQPTKYVIYGQKGAQMADAIKQIICENDTDIDNDMVYNDFRIIDLTDPDLIPELDDLILGSVVVIENGHLLPSKYDELKLRLCEVVIIVLNNFPPHAAQNNKSFWDKEFDFNYVCTTPDNEFFKNYFKRQVETFNAKKTNSFDLKESDYELLALAADSCLVGDVDKFCKKMFYDVILGEKIEKKIDIDLLTEKYLSLISGTAVYTIEDDIQSRRPKRAIQEQFERNVNKRIKKSN